VSPSDRLAVDRLTVSWAGAAVLSDVSLRVAPREVVTLMGPNGSGKTTLLRCVAGFETPLRGTIRLDGRSLEGIPPHRRGVGMLSQDPALFPHRTVAENVAYGPELRRWPEADVDRRVAEMTALLGLRGLEDRTPDRLSGGERQRVALARALLSSPPLLLADEPTGNLDARNGENVLKLIADLRAKTGKTFIIATHDPVVASHADHAIRIVDGQIGEIDYTSGKITQ
jgi:ABC-type Fe3+/spermidine/putrescine transport system ATPase subunit